MATYPIIGVRKSQGISKIGGLNDYTQFGADGTLRFVGNATVWDDLLPSSITLGSGNTAPSFTAYNGNLFAYEFVGSGVQAKQLNMGFQLSHKYKEGSDIHPHLHLFIPDNVAGGYIKFYCEYTWTNIGDTGAVTTTTISNILTRTANQGIDNNIIFSLGTIVGTGKKISSMLMCRIYRDPTDGADTFGNSVWLKSADIHIECDMNGSSLIFTK